MYSHESECETSTKDDSVSYSLFLYHLLAAKSLILLSSDSDDAVALYHFKHCSNISAT